MSAARRLYEERRAERVIERAKLVEQFVQHYPGQERQTRAVAELLLTPGIRMPIRTLARLLAVATGDAE